MKTKIYQNREGLQGKKVQVQLCGRLYMFKIMYVTRKEITVYTTIKFKDMMYTDSKSLEGTIKNLILENTPDNSLDFPRRTFLASGKLKKMKVGIDGINFKFDQITNSGLRLVRSISYDELFGCEKPSFTYDILNFVENNISDNPPRVSKPGSYRNYGFHSFLFDFSFSTPVDLSEEKIERNRKKYKKQRKEEKRKREKGKQLDKMLNLDKKPNTRELARFR